MKVNRLAGRHHMSPFLCPKCGLSIDTVSGMKRGTLKNNECNPKTVRMMICARCETAIAKWDDKNFALDAAAEATLTREVRDTLTEIRNQLRIDKASGRIRIPRFGP